MNCLYCDRRLDCETCGAPYAPRDQAEYEALGRVEVPVICPDCGEVVVCHWCKTPYDGQASED